MDDITEEYRRMPGLFRLWDLQFVLERSDDWRIHYSELTEDGTPLFAIYRRKVTEMTR